MSKTERFQLTNVNERDLLRKFAKPNRGYLKAKRLRPGDIEYEYTFKVPSPTIEEDPRGLLVVKAAGVIIGNVKKGSCSHIRKLISDKCKIKLEVGGGKYVTNNLDGGDLKVYKGSYRIWANLIIN